MNNKLDNILKKYNAYICNTSALHGFFSSVLCAPAYMMSPNDMAIIIFNDINVNWLDTKDPQIFMKEATALWNQTIDVLNKKLPYKPICYKDQEGQYIIKDWIEGFVEGILRLPNFWKILLEDENNQELLLPIIILYNSKQLPLSLLNNNFNKNISKAECIALLNTNIPKIHEYFSIFRSKAIVNPFSQLEEATDRKLCSCGLSREYKNCCIERVTLN
jgi:yecA family protein